MFLATTGRAGNPGMDHGWCVCVLQRGSLLFSLHGDVGTIPIPVPTPRVEYLPPITQLTIRARAASYASALCLGNGISRSD